MRRVALVFVLFWMLIGGPARAEYPDEHPEYFGLTEPTEQGFALQPLPASEARYAVRIGDLEIYGDLHLSMSGERILFIAAGEAEMSQLEAYIVEYPFLATEVGYVDLDAAGVPVLDGKAVGDFFPFLVSDGAKARIVDPRYNVKNPHDDAAGSALAAHWKTCAYRPPIFITRGYIEPLGEGRCIISKAIYSRSPGLTDAEVDGQLRAFFGCDKLIALQALQQDGEGRLDTFVRRAGESTILVGVYDQSQDSANRYLMTQAAETLTEVLGDSFEVVTVAMPDPIVLGNQTLRPSYLQFVATKSALIVPTFDKNDSWQTKAVASLLKAMPALELKLLDATELTYASSRLTSIIAPFPDLEFDEECTPPETTCQSGVPLECGTCFDECWKTGKLCVSDGDYGKCAKAEDGCYDLQILACPEDSVCVGDGGCEAGPGACEDVPPGGFCDGDTVTKCVGSTMLKENCGLEGQFCTVNENDEAVCFLPCFDDCVPDTTFCDGNAVFTCRPLPAAGEDCGQRKPVEVCEDGLICVDGSCVEPPPEPSPDTTEAPEVVATEDTHDWNAGYKKTDDGCSASLVHSHSSGWSLTALLLALGLALSYRRRTTR